MNIFSPLIITFCSILIAVFCKRLTTRFVKTFWFLLRKVSHSVVGGVLFFTGLTFLMELFLGLYIHSPYPIIHDEFAYLLSADTFASGRLTNPTHPLWEHFESFHIIQQPSYQSKYPPAQGAFLAVGQVLFDLPIVGSWIALAAANGTIFWMLCGWVPRRWAVYGGFLATLNSSFLVTWGQCYWGGQVALLGGALLFGAYPRLKKKPRVNTSVILALGLAILANSRPYEGLLAALPIAIALLCWLFGNQKPGWSVAVSRIIVPMFVILIPTFLGMGYYNYRVTGNALTFPYKVWVDQYYSKTFDGLIFSVNKETSRKQPVRTIYSYDLDDNQLEPKFALQSKPSQFKLWYKLWRFILYYTGSYAVVLICFFGICAFFRNRENLFVLIISLLVITATVSQDTSGHPHYIAPIGCLLILLQIQCLRYSYQWKRNLRLVGQILSVTVLVLTTLTTIESFANNRKPVPGPSAYSWALIKQQISEKLDRVDGKHLILVKYDRDHIYHNEWVYNEADIDNSKVVWARILEPKKNDKLVSYFKDRSIWVVEVDSPKIELLPYRRKQK
jgi:hypothetical protein